jgi:hypothetical protein
VCVQCRCDVVGALLRLWDHVRYLMEYGTVRSTVCMAWDWEYAISRSYPSSQGPNDKATFTRRDLPRVSVQERLGCTHASCDAHKRCACHETHTAAMLTHTRRAAEESQRMYSHSSAAKQALPVYTH